MRVVDLSQPLGPETAGWPGDGPFVATPDATVDVDGSYSRRVDLHEHMGTHFDAPAHFVRDGLTVDAIAAERLVVPVRVIDISAQVDADRDYALAVADIEEMEAMDGMLESGQAVLVRTGWDRFLNDRARYIDDLRFPGVGVEAAELLVRRGVIGIGIDTLSIDRGVATEFPVHLITLPAGLWHVEGLVGIDRVPSVGAMLVVGVPLVKDASGFPARVLALLP